MLPYATIALHQFRSRRLRSLQRCFLDELRMQVSSRFVNCYVCALLIVQTEQVVQMGVPRVVKTEEKLKDPVRQAQWYKSDLQLTFTRALCMLIICIQFTAVISITPYVSSLQVMRALKTQLEYVSTHNLYFFPYLQRLYDIPYLQRLYDIPYKRMSKAYVTFLISACITLIKCHYSTDWTSLVKEKRCTTCPQVHVTT